MRRKPDHPFIDCAVDDAIEYAVSNEHIHDPAKARKIVQRAARRVGGHYGMRLNEVRWIVRTVIHRLGV